MHRSHLAPMQHCISSNTVCSALIFFLQICSPYSFWFQYLAFQFHFRSLLHFEGFYYSLWYPQDQALSLASRLLPWRSWAHCVFLSPLWMVLQSLAYWFKKFLKRAATDTYWPGKAGSFLTFLLSERQGLYRGDILTSDQTPWINVDFLHYTQT